MITPQQHIKVKEECRRRKVEVYSIFSYNTENLREESSVKEIIFRSNLRTEEVYLVALYYFEEIGYVGKVSVRHVKDDIYRAILSKRLRY